MSVDAETESSKSPDDMEVSSEDGAVESNESPITPAHAPPSSEIAPQAKRGRVFRGTFDPRPLPLFPLLDVCTGTATALNDTIPMTPVMTSNTQSKLDVSAVHMQLMLAASRGTKTPTVNDASTWGGTVSTTQEASRSYQKLSAAVMNEVVASAPEGRHVVDKSILGVLDTNLDLWGAGLRGYGWGLGREDNRAYTEALPMSLGMDAKTAEATTDNLRMNDNDVRPITVGLPNF